MSNFKDENRAKKVAEILNAKAEECLEKAKKSEAEMKILNAKAKDNETRTLNIKAKKHDKKRELSKSKMRILSEKAEENIVKIKLFEKKIKSLSMKANEYNENRTRVLSLKVEDTEVNAEAKPKGKGIILIEGVKFKAINEDTNERNDKNQDSSKTRYAYKTCEVEAPKTEGFKKHGRRVQEGYESSCNQRRDKVSPKSKFKNASQPDHENYEIDRGKREEEFTLKGQPKEIWNGQS